MSPEPAPSPAGRALLTAAVLYGLGIYAALPAGVVACNDDFGYLKSVVQTLQHGRPWTDDWLEPWSASLSVLAAGLYLLTGHFPFAVHGLLAALAAVSFLGAAALLRARGLRPAAAIGGAVVLLTFPVLLWKTLEFTGVAVYLPCLFWALWAAEKQRWGLFGVAWAVAAASRQSAVVWLALPAVEVARHALRRSRGTAAAWRGPALVLVLAAPWLALLAGGMNTSHAQIVRTGALFWRTDAGASLAAATTGVAVFALSAGLGAWGLVLGRPVSDGLRPWPRRGWLLGVGLALAVAAIDPRPWLHWDIVTFEGGIGFLYWKLMVAAAAAGWLLVPLRIAPGFAALAGASLLLLTLRGDRYDYYFADLALAAFFGLRAPVNAPVPAADATPGAGPAGLRLILGFGLIVLAVAHVRSGYLIKLTLDRAWALCSLYEPALRAGKLGPGELRDAPFGYIGWHLHPFAAARGSDTFRRFASLDRRASTVVWEIAPPPPSPVPADTLAVATHALGGLGPQRFLLRRIAPPATDDVFARDYRLVPFPLDAAEWRQLITATPLPSAVKK